MNKIIIPFSDSGCRIPLITLSIDGVEYTALLDTGSESTLFDYRISESNNYKKNETDYKMSLVGLSGETEKGRIVEVSTNVSVNDIFNNQYVISINGITSDLTNVTECINERYGKHMKVFAVIGSDTLKMYGAKIDYRRQQLTIKR